MYEQLGKIIRPTEPLSAVRRAIDPASRLPRTILARNESYDPDEHRGCDCEPSYGYDICASSGKVGELAFGERPNTGELHLAAVRVDRRGEGFGIAAYVLAIEAAHANSRAFATDLTVTPLAYKMWNRFIELGVAQVVVPFEGIDPLLPFEEQRYYVGDVRVEPKA